MKETPLVSIYMPTCNRLALLKRAIASVQHQLYSRWELIVVNDCSSDGTAEYLDSLDDPRIKVVHNPVPMGACISRNLAIVAACGTFVTGLDDDDYFMPQRLVDFLSAWAELADSGSEFAFLFDDVRVLRPTEERIHKWPKRVGLSRLIGHNCVGSQVFCKRDDLIAAGLFHPQLPAWQDWDMWTRLARRFGEGVNIGKVTYVMDEGHEFARISQKPEHVLRYAMQLFCQRNRPMTAPERASVFYNLTRYPQVRPRLSDYLQMLPLVFSGVLFWRRVGVLRDAS